MASPHPDGWMLGYAFDPKNASPTHPLHHIQFLRTTPSDPPFVNWRLPFGVTDPEAILEYLVALIV